MQVRLITLSDDPEFSTASIAESARDKAKLRRVGDQVGPFRVKTMDWDRVWFDGPGGRCAVGMHPGSQRVAQGEDSKRPGFELTFVDPKPAKKPTLLDAGEQPSWWLPHALARGIDRRGPTELRLSRTAVDGIYDQAEELLEHVTLQALGTPEAPGGLRIEEVRTDSLLDHLGLETGDVLLALDGQASSTRDALISMLRESRANDQLVAKLQRGGDTLEIEVRVR